MVKSFIAAIAIALVGSTAFAADLAAPAPPPAPEYQPAQPTESSGWYLRGDVGYSLNNGRGASYFQGSNASEVDFATANLRDSYTIGGGVGYQVTHYLRTDLTLDYLTGADFRGSTTGSCGVAANCVSTDIASMTAWSLMANAYVDIGTWYYVTPYIGAGIGGTNVSWGNLSNTACDVSNPASCDATQTHDGNSSWRFTYALMAGASVDVTCNLKADIGYRYLNVGGDRMFGYKLNGGPGRDKGFESHQIKGGLRYTFGGCDQPAPPVYSPPPVYK